MQKKYFEDQFDDEDVLLVFNNHPIVMRREIIIASVLLLLGTLPGLIKPTYTVFFGGLFIGFLLAFVIMLFAWMNWHFSVYVVTNQRFIQIKHRGLWKRSIVDLGLDKIQMVSFEIGGFQQALLGSGTIVIQTYVGELVIHDVHKPSQIQKRMSHILREQGFSNNNPPMID